MLLGVEYLNISTGHSTFPTVEEEGQLMQLFFTWSARRLVDLDSGWYLLFVDSLFENAYIQTCIFVFSQYMQANGFLFV